MVEHSGENRGTQVQILAAAAIAVVGAAIASFLFWWPLLHYVWKYWNP
jgi:hypothetical protein